MYNARILVQQELGAGVGLKAIVIAVGFINFGDEKFFSRTYACLLDCSDTNSYASDQCVLANCSIRVSNANVVA